jgi:hypothetical protein
LKQNFRILKNIGLQNKCLRVDFATEGKEENQGDQIGRNSAYRAVVGHFFMTEVAQEF